VSLVHTREPKEVLLRTASILFTLLTYLLNGCQASPTLPDAPPDSISSPLATLPATGDVEMTPSILPPEEPGLQDLITNVKADLAGRLSLPAEEITLLEYTEVEWSDSSMDCPEPGMSYLQVITPGYRIILQANGNSYEYHSNRDSYFVYCEGRVPPIVPQP
jgi:hypothetical protein